METKEAKLDLKDKKILYLMDFNARMSYSQIAKAVGFPSLLVNLTSEPTMIFFLPIIFIKYLPGPEPVGRE